MRQQNQYNPGCLGTRKTRALQALLQYGTKEKAAQEAGISVVTLWRWLKQPPFQEALHQARREAFSQSTGRLQQASVVRHAECRLSRDLRARLTFSRMSAALAVQMNGLG